ncbi:hypothetical protein [Natrononativus amylolyticus]|uniref:hypothetical protein n=1 Tax=Natrononativus amylolyticus TaxID=2963434 RepID=UPI0020CC1D00|nr:hypothetical protein [Natrononativus amylolyticus]
MTSATVTRWSRAFVAAGVLFFVAWQLAVVAGSGRRLAIVLGLYGFVFHVVFGKAYALIPSYFARSLAFPRAPAVHLPLALLGTAGLAADSIGVGPPQAGSLGAGLWLGGCLVFVGAIGWTVRDNLLGGETGTGEANAHRRRVDRLANAFVPVVVAYLLAGSAVPVLESVGFDPSPLPAGGPAATHLLAAGAGALLVFAIGFRLLPRFLVTTPRFALVALVLPAGALAPALLATDFLGGATFRIGAVLQAVAIGGFAVAYADMFYRSERRRVGFYAVLAGALCGVAAVGLGLTFAFGEFAAGAFDAHYRLALAGFLGLTIVGVSYQFYPPAIGTTPGVGDRTAHLSTGLLVGGLTLEAAGLLRRAPDLERGGSLLVLTGAALYAFVVLAVFLERR